MITEIELRLQLWGLAYGVRLPKDDDQEVEPEGASSLARVTVDRSREAQVVDRRDRSLLTRSAPVARRLIQRQLGESCRVPSWAGGEPMRAPRDQGSGGGCMPEAFDSPETDQIERLVLDLQRWDRRAALALRAHYCLRGRRPLSERIAWVAEKAEVHVSRMTYRGALARGRLQVWQAIQSSRKNTG